MGQRPTAKSDADLVRATLAGERAAFDALIRRHFGLVYVIALARLDDAERAEDLAQEVFLRAYVHLAQLDPPAKFPAWLSRIARNLAIDWHRRGQRASRLLPMIPMEALAGDVADPDAKGVRETMAETEESQVVRRAIAALPPEQREIVLLRFTEGLSQSEIAERLGVHQTTVSRVLRRALAALRGQLEPILRQAAPRLGPATRATVRTVAVIAAFEAMAPAAKAALVTASHLPAASAAFEAELVASAGGLLGSLLSLLSGGAKAMATGKGIAAAIAAAAAITAGGVYVATHGPAEPPPEPAPIVFLGEAGQTIPLARVPADLFQRLDSDPNAAPAVADQLNPPQIPAAQALQFRVPDPEKAPHFVGLLPRTYNLSTLGAEPGAPGTEVHTPENGPGDWEFTLYDCSPGDLLLVQLVSQRSAQPDVWAAQIVAEQPTASAESSSEPVTLWLDLTPGTAWTVRQTSRTVGGARTDERRRTFDVRVLEPEEEGTVRLESTGRESVRDGAAQELPREPEIVTLGEDLRFVQMQPETQVGITDRVTQLALFPGGLPEGPVRVGETWTRDDVQFWGDAIRPDAASRLESVQMVNGRRLAVVTDHLVGESGTGPDLVRGETDIVHRLWVDQGQLDSVEARWRVWRGGRLIGDSQYQIDLEYPPAVSGGAASQTSPETVARAMFDALRAGDFGRAAPLFATRSQVDAVAQRLGKPALSEAEAQRMEPQRREKFDRVARLLGELDSVEYEGLEARNPNAPALLGGDLLDNVRVRVREDGPGLSGVEATITLDEMVRLGGRWYLIDGPRM